jgi:HlyD family secretion protein
MASLKTTSSLRRYQLFGLLLIILLFAGLGGWAAIASISGAVIAPARIVVETNSKKVQHSEGGIIAEILIANGERVAAGQLLLRLDETETRASLAIVNAQLDELLARQARLEAERGKDAEIAWPAELTARLDNPRVRTAYDGQATLFLARRAATQGEQEQLRQRIGQLGEEIDGIDAQRTSKDRQLQLIQDELASLKGLEQQGLVRLNRIRALERESAKLEGERGALIAQTGGKRGEISETGLRIIQIDKKLSSEVNSELRDVQTKVAELTEKRAAAEVRLRRTELRAPRSGVIHQLGVHTIGGVLTAGEPAMLIIPEQDELVFEARVSPSDIDQIQIGQTSRIQLRAYDPAQHVSLRGKVTLISPDSIADGQTGAHYYLVRAAVGKEERALLGDRPLLPGMLAELFIETKTRTVISYLLKPISDRGARIFRER